MQVGASCSVMRSDCEMIVDDVMIFGLGKGLFQINRHDVLIFGMCD